MEYICKNCGEKHYEMPALAFNAPFHYHILSSQEKEQIVDLDDDFCIIKHDDQTDRFIRVVLRQKIMDSCEFLEYGLWVSLSENSYKDYQKNFNSWLFYTRS